MFGFKFGASPNSSLVSLHKLPFCLCEELCDEAISGNTPPPGLPRFWLAMTGKGDNDKARR